MPDDAVISSFNAQQMQQSIDYLRGRFNELMVVVIQKELRDAQKFFDELIMGLQQSSGAAGSHTAPGMRLFIASLAFMIKATKSIECGLDAGITAEALILGSTESHGEVIGVETNSDPAQLYAYPHYSHVHEEALGYLRKVGPDCIDLIVIDDDHSEGHVREEIVEVKRVLRPQGIGIFHDVFFHPHIERAIRELMVGWDMIMLPAWSPPINADMGCGLVRKPA